MKYLKTTTFLSLAIFLLSFSCGENNKKEVSDEENAKMEAFEIKKRNLIDEINQALANVEKDLMKVTDNKSLERKLNRSKNRLENSLERLSRSSEDDWKEVEKDIQNALNDVDNTLDDIKKDLNDLSDSVIEKFK